MSSENKRREAGQRAFPTRPHLVLVPKPVSDHVAPKVELAPEVKEMLREMNRKRSKVKETDPPDAA